MKQNLEFNEFLSISEKMEIKIGQIVEVERIPKNKKMIKMVVLFDDNNTKTVVSNIGGNMEDVNQLLNLYYPFVTNLTPAERNGYLSEAMILCDVNQDNSFNFEIKKAGYKIL